MCQADASNVNAPFSALVTLEVTVLDTATLSGPFTLFLNSLIKTGYDASDVTIDLNPTAPAGLDTMAVPGFVFTGSFTPFVHLEFTSVGGSVALFDYIGWTVADGDFVTFRYDVDRAPVGGMAPQLTANAAPVVVPEPTSAVLMALGLAGLAVGGNRRR